MMAAYGGWMNGRMLDLCGALPDAERERDLGAFFKLSGGRDGELAGGNHVVCQRDGKTRLLPRWVLVAHMFNHATHHRGQLTRLMKQLGVEHGVTDLPWLPALYDGKVLRATQM